MGLGAETSRELREGDTIDSFYHFPTSSPASLYLKSAEIAIFPPQYTDHILAYALMVNSIVSQTLTCSCTCLVAPDTG